MEPSPCTPPRRELSKDINYTKVRNWGGNIDWILRKSTRFIRNMCYGPPTSWKGGRWIQLWNSYLLSFLKLWGHDRFLWCFELSFVLSRYSIYQTLFCSWQFLFDDIKLPLGVQAHKWQYFYVVIMEKTDYRPKFHAMCIYVFMGHWASLTPNKL